MKKHLNKISCISFLVIFVLIQVFQGFNNYYMMKQPPSAEWSKEVLVSSGTLYTSPKLVKYNDGYILAHDDDKVIKVIKLDSLGRKALEKSFDIGGTTARDINIITDGKDILVNWSVTNSDTSYNFKLDSSLNEKAGWHESGVVESSEIGKSAIIKSFKDRIECYSIDNDSKLSIKVDSPLMVRGTDTTKGYLVTFIDSDENYRYFFIKDNVAGDIVNTGLKGSRNEYEYSSYAVGSDGKKFCIIRQSKGKSGAETQPPIECMSYTIDGGAHDSWNLYFNGASNVLNIVPSNIKDEIRFTASGDRRYIRSIQGDVFDFTIGSKRMPDTVYMSKTAQISTYPSMAEDAAVFSDYVSQNRMNIFMTSTQDAFKNAANAPKPEEKKEAAFEALDYMMKGIALTFFLCLGWLFAGIFIIGLMCFISLALKDRTKKLAFIATCVLTAVLKTQFIYGKVYKANISILRGLLSKPAFGIFILLLISFLCFAEAYRSYKQDLDKFPIMSFVIYGLLDAVLTVTLFYPFILYF
jgi:hypothetical protein